MKYEPGRAVLSILGIFLALGLVVGTAYATPPPPLTGTGFVSYLTVSGSGSGATCNTSTPWPLPANGAGNVGFPNNLGGPGYGPLVSNGELICIHLTLSGQTPASATYTVTSPRLTVVVTGNNTFTSSGGAANVYMIFSVTTTGVSTTGCFTAPIQISPDVGGTASTGNAIGHLVYGTTCSTVHVPEFPMATMGVAMMLAALAPFMLLLKKKYSV